MTIINTPSSIQQSSIQKIERSKKDVTLEIPKKTPLGISEAFPRDTISSANDIYTVADIEKTNSRHTTNNAKEQWLLRYITLSMEAENIFNEYANQIEQKFNDEDKKYKSVITKYAKSTQEHLKKVHTHNVWNIFNNLLSPLLSMVAIGASVKFTETNNWQLTKSTATIMGTAFLSLAVPAKLDWLSKKVFPENEQSQANFKTFVFLANTIAMVLLNIKAFQLLMPQDATTTINDTQLAKILEIATSAAKGIGMIGESITQFQAKRAEIKEKRSESLNGEHETNVKTLSNSMESMQENEKNLFSQMADSIGTEIEAMRIVSSIA